MKRYLYLIGLLFLFLHLEAHACTCTKYYWSPEQVKHDLHFSELVFIAEPIFKNSKEQIINSYYLKVIEVIKGTVNNDTLIGNYWSSCSGVPNHKGRWIIYSEHIQNDSISYSECGLTRNISTFDKHPFDIDETDIETRRSEWQKEYVILKQEIENSKKEVQANRRAVNMLTYTAIALVFLLICVFLLYNSWPSFKS
ncbi:hypothetical protein [Nibribacter koreensis]|uniref:hypothetical protein n=1 Tax=Nibribacter koreensis TaxID=1084519 RepID=UPI0031EE9C56